MNKTKIEWADFTWNPVVGCKNGCDYCYARKIFKRFNSRGDSFTDIRLYLERLREPLSVKKPSRIFVGSMCDLFAKWTPKEYIEKVINIIKQCPQHTFMFLTKYPKGYKRIRKYPKNCWLGTTVTSYREWKRVEQLWFNKKNNLKFVSIEPILDQINSLYFYLPDWIILGGLTPKPIHKNEWIEDFLGMIRNSDKPIFMKSNLKPAWRGKLRQEWPKIGEA